MDGRPYYYYLLFSRVINLLVVTAERESECRENNTLCLLYHHHQKFPPCSAAASPIYSFLQIRECMTKDNVWLECIVACMIDTVVVCVYSIIFFSLFFLTNQTDSREKVQPLPLQAFVLYSPTVSFSPFWNPTICNVFVKIQLLTKSCASKCNLIFAFKRLCTENTVSCGSEFQLNNAG